MASNLLTQTCPDLLMQHLLRLLRSPKRGSSQQSHCRPAAAAPCGQMLGTQHNSGTYARSCSTPETHTTGHCGFKQQPRVEIFLLDPGLLGLLRHHKQLTHLDFQVHALMSLTPHITIHIRQPNSPPKANLVVHTVASTLK